MNKEGENGKTSEPQRPQGHHKTYLQEENYNKTSSREEKDETAAKDYHKEAPRKLRFQALNRNGDYAPVHKVSRSCSPKDSETNPRHNDKDQDKSTALQKKRERYHSQRRKVPPLGCENIISSQKPIISATRINSSNPAHPLGNMKFLHDSPVRQKKLSPFTKLRF